MTSPVPPQTPLHRITLFYGPEPVDGHPGVVHCVFNVKKRSWKAGIQVTVEVSSALVSEIAAAINFDRWLADLLGATPDPPQAHNALRAHDALVQILCQLKLELALETGVTAENQCLPAETWSAEVLQGAPAARHRISSYVAAELDLPGP